MAASRSRPRRYWLFKSEPGAFGWDDHDLAVHAVVRRFGIQNAGAEGDLRTIR